MLGTSEQLGMRPRCDRTVHFDLPGIVTSAGDVVGKGLTSIFVHCGVLQQRSATFPKHSFSMWRARLQQVTMQRLVGRTWSITTKHI